MGVPVFIAIVFALVCVGVFAVNKVHAKRMGAPDLELLEAYREVDAMGLNGPRMSPGMPAEMTTVQFGWGGRVHGLHVPRDVADDPTARERAVAETISRLEKSRGLMNAPPPTPGQQRLLANAAPADPWGARQQEAAPSYPRRPEYNAVAAANDEYHRQAAEAAGLNAALAEWQRGAQGQA